jgi:hypothetical protein
MKIWHSFGSEHSMNLVMIGRFQNVGDAELAKDIIDQVIAQVSTEVQSGIIEVGEQNTDTFSDDMRSLLSRHQIYTLGPAELEQFAYEVRLRVEDQAIVITSDESDLSAFLKIMVDKGARVEVYSAHRIPGTGYGRGG